MGMKQKKIFLEWMGLNFYYYDGLQPKISAGMIKEHECISEILSYIFKSRISCEKTLSLDGAEFCFDV